MSVITTKFDLGQEVFRVSHDHEVIELPCRFCRGRGWLDTAGANGERRSLKCPDCSTQATVRLGSWPRYYADPKPLTIGLITVRVFGDAPLDYAGSSELKDEEGYMAWSTGVGSGTVHRAEDLFATLEEAEAEAEERTERARAGEAIGTGSWQRQWWPSAEQVRIAAGFLDHRDVYEHNAAHIVLAEQILAVDAARGEVAR